MLHFVTPPTFWKDYAWAEVMRVHMNDREGITDYGIWFWKAIGSGIWVNVGASFRSTHRSRTLQELDSAGLINKWLEQSRSNITNTSRPKPFIIGRYQLGFSNQIQPNPLPVHVRHNKEAFPYLANALGFDSVQLDDCADNTSELVITTQAAMHQRAPIKVCPPLPLAWGHTQHATALAVRFLA